LRCGEKKVGKRSKRAPAKELKYRIAYGKIIQDFLELLRNRPFFQRLFSS
jgi:hypothetical protein